MKTFEEYLKDGIAKKQTPDLSRSRALALEAGASYAVLYSFLNAVKLSDENANHVIKNAYDIIMELLRSKMLAQGYNATGKGAHEAEVAYMHKLGFSVQDIEFTDKLRYYRNGIVYYGKNFDMAYAQKVLAFLEKIRKHK